MPEERTERTSGASIDSRNARKAWRAPALTELRTEDTAHGATTGNDGNGQSTAQSS